MMPRPFFKGNQAIYKEVIPMTQIVVLDGFTENPGDLSWAGLEALGQLRVYPRTKPEEIIPRIG